MFRPGMRSYRFLSDTHRFAVAEVQCSLSVKKFGGGLQGQTPLYTKEGGASPSISPDTYLFPMDKGTSFVKRGGGLRRPTDRGLYR
jgi:hypothetical protein